jgi:hypothetical protein
MLVELLRPPCAGDFHSRGGSASPPAEAEEAADMLVEKGLATRQGEFVAASGAALELDRPWPLAT